MKRTFTPFRELMSECRALAKLRRDIAIIGAKFRGFIIASRKLRRYWFTRCMEGVR